MNRSRRREIEFWRQIMDGQCSNGLPVATYCRKTPNFQGKIFFLLSSNTQILVIMFDGMADSASDRERSELSGMFRLLGDSRRLGVLLACRQKQRSVTEVAGAVGCSMALASHHLRLLRLGNLVEARRVGRQAFYRLADTHVSRMLDQMLHHARHCTAPMKTRPSKRPA